MATFFENLFGFERPFTRGEMLYQRGFEAFVVYWVIYFAWYWGGYLHNISDVVLPLGIAGYLDIRFMFNEVVPLAVAAATTVSVLLGFLGWWRYGYLAGLLLMHLMYVSRYSLGEISHGSNIIGFLLLGLALGAFGYRERVQSLRFALGFAYFFVGFGYTSAAFCKLIATGPAWVDGSHLWMWIAERTVDTFSITGEVNYNLLQEWTLTYWPLATAILTFGLLTELMGIGMWFPKLRPWVATLLIGMHFGILFTMKIDFPANTWTLLVIGFPWDRWANAALSTLPCNPMLEKWNTSDVSWREG